MQQQRIERQFVRNFGMSKEELLKNWATLSREELKAVCKQYSVQVGATPDLTYNALMTHLKRFEADMAFGQNDSFKEERLDSNSALPSEDPIKKQFGKSASEQTDEWLEMSNDDLQKVCERLSLRVSTKHIENVQTLLNHLKGLQGSQGSEQQSTVKNKTSGLEDAVAHATRSQRPEIGSREFRDARALGKGKRLVSPVIQKARAQAEAEVNEFRQRLYGAEQKGSTIQEGWSSSPAYIRPERVRVGIQRHGGQYAGFDGFQVKKLISQQSAKPVKHERLLSNENFEKKLSVLNKQSSEHKRIKSYQPEQLLQVFLQENQGLFPVDEFQKLDKLQQQQVTLNLRLLRQAEQGPATPADTPYRKLLQVPSEATLRAYLEEHSLTLGQCLHLSSHFEKCPSQLLDKICSADSTDRLSIAEINKLSELAPQISRKHKYSFNKLLATIDFKKLTLEQNAQLATNFSKSKNLDDGLMSPFLYVAKKQIFSIKNAEELEQVLTILESQINARSALTIHIMETEFRSIINAIDHLSQQIEIPTSLLMRASICLNSSMQTPSFLFDDLAERKDLLKTEKTLIDKLVSMMLFRCQQLRVTFDHLSASSARMHRGYRHITSDSLQLMRRLLEGVNGWKIIADPVVFTRLFDSPEQMNVAADRLIQSIQLDQSLTLDDLSHILKGIHNFQWALPRDLRPQIAKVALLTDALLKKSTVNIEAILELNQIFLQLSAQKPLITPLYQSTGLQKIVDNFLRSHFDGSPIKNASQLADSNQLGKSQVTQSQFERMAGTILTHYQYNRELRSRDFIQKLSNSRSLHGEDLLTIFQLDAPDEFLMNAANNLSTITLNQFGDAFEEVNTQTRQEHMVKLGQILDKYLDIYQRRPDLFSTGYSLAPLSKIFSDLLETLAHEKIAAVLTMLGHECLDNYSEELIVKLYENYSEPAFMQDFFQQNTKHFMEFAKRWPAFLRNNAILNQLVKINFHEMSVQDQSETIQILKRKSVLHPELMNAHLLTFMRMKDREAVKDYLRKYLAASAFFGFSKNINIEQITQVLRRLYKSPDELDTTQILDFLTMLGSSQQYFGDFDPKSVTWIEQALDFVESKFTGTSFVEVDKVTDIKETFQQASGTSHKHNLVFFNAIPNQSKQYNKRLVFNLNFADDMSSIRGAANQLKEKLNRTEQLVEKETSDEEIVPDEEGEQAGSSDEESATGEKKDKTNKQGKKNYDRKATESTYQEDFEYLNFRNKRLSDLDKRGKHMLTYSNINQLNFVDINRRDEARAWAVLLHFRSKSMQSMLYEEFSSVSQRNQIGKTRHHDLFSKLFLALTDRAWQEGLRVKMAQCCETSGWPIDLQVQSSSDGQIRDAIYFLLNEELCFNAESGEEEPLGLQKLMMRHLHTLSNHRRVHVITEAAAARNLDFAVEETLLKIKAE